MASKKDSTILYHDQIAIVRKWLNAEQIGRLMVAIFEFEEGGDPEVDEDIGMAFDFLSLQARIDRKKYEEKCEINRRNGAKGGAPKGNQNARKQNNLETTSKQPQNNHKIKGQFETTKTTEETLGVEPNKQQKQPKQPNAKKNNPNDNENDNDTLNDDDKSHDHSRLFGTFDNVELTDTEYSVLKSTYERVEELIDKVSIWVRSAKYDVPDHYGLCVKFANNDQWPKRKVIEPVEIYEPVDPLTEEEQEMKMAAMRARLNDALPAG